MTKNKIPEKRADAARWEVEEMGTKNFTTDNLKARTVGSFEKGTNPAPDTSDESLRNLLEG